VLTHLLYSVPCGYFFLLGLPLWGWWVEATCTYAIKKAVTASVHRTFSMLRAEGYHPLSLFCLIEGRCKYAVISFNWFVVCSRYWSHIRNFWNAPCSGSAFSPTSFTVLFCKWQFPTAEHISTSCL
jgi:hypothetical protein